MVTYAPIELGEGSWIGAWCSVGRGVTIGKRSVVSGMFTPVLVCFFVILSFILLFFFFCSFLLQNRSVL